MSEGICIKSVVPNQWDAKGGSQDASEGPWDDLKKLGKTIFDGYYSSGLQMIKIKRPAYSSRKYVT